MVMASGETYERSYWILAGRLKWVIWKSHPLSVMLEALAVKTEVIYLLQCDCRPGREAYEAGGSVRSFPTL